MGEIEENMITQTKEQELPKEFEDMVNTLLFPKKFWDIFERLQKESFEQGKAQANAKWKEAVQKWIKIVEDTEKDGNECVDELKKIFGKLINQSPYKCLFSTGNKCNSNYGLGLFCDGINVPEKCPYKSPNKSEKVGK